MTVEQTCRVFLKIYPEKLFLPPVTSPVRKLFEFVNFIQIHSSLYLCNIWEVHFGNAYFLFIC